MEKRRIGIFSGSFNPIHWGHIILGGYLVEHASLDEVWYVVSPHNPLKEQSQLIDDRLRWEMVLESLLPYPKLHACDVEFSLPSPSYTINTLEHLSQLYPMYRFFLIIGADNWIGIEQWRNYKKLLHSYPIIIYPRQGCSINEAPVPLNATTTYVAAPLIELSSTFVRESNARGEDISYYVPPCVANRVKEWAK